MKTDNTFFFNFVVVILFLCLNPLYALSICAVFNFMNYRINFWLFSIMFASSFGLFFFLRNWNIGLDAIHYLMTFRMADIYSFTEIFSRFDFKESGMEPLWHIYLKLSRIIIGDYVDYFAYFILFAMFLLTAYLGKVVDEKRFVVVIACILFVSPGFFSTAYQIWRHNFALLLFFIGIFLLEADRHRRLARGLMYSSALFHVLAIPLVAGYEILPLIKKITARFKVNTGFKAFQKYSIQIVVYAILGLVIIIWAEKFIIEQSFVQSTSYKLYQKEIGDVQSGKAVLFNPLTAALLVYFWFFRKEISQNDIFIGVNYFLVISALILGNLPSSPLSRVFAVFLVGASILSAKFVLKDKTHGLLYLVLIILFEFYTLIKQGGDNLKLLIGGEFLNPVYGLVGMILNYDKFLVLPSTVL